MDAHSVVWLHTPERAAMNGTTSGADIPLRPKALSVATENIPAELTLLNHWVVWRYELDETNKHTKVPYQVSGKHASTTDLSTWASFDDAIKRYRDGGVDGIGIVLTTDMGIVGVDLDHCRDPKTGKVEEWAVKIVRLFNSYSEVSPSGTGIRIFTKGILPKGGRKKGNVEIYSSGRYLTTTGNIL